MCVRLQGAWNKARFAVGCSVQQERAACLQQGNVGEEFLKMYWTDFILPLSADLVLAVLQKLKK